MRAPSFPTGAPISRAATLLVTAMVAACAGPSDQGPASPPAPCVGVTDEREAQELLYFPLRSCLLAGRDLSCTVLCNRAELPPDVCERLTRD